MHRTLQCQSHSLELKALAMVFSSTRRVLVVSADGTTAPPDAGVDTYAAASAHVDSDSAGTAAYGAAEPQACVDTCAALVDAAGVDAETDDVATNQPDACVSAVAVARAAGTDAADVCAGFDADALRSLILCVRAWWLALHG